MPTAVVTGATSGIGRAVALALLDAGYDVLAIGRNEQALDALRREGVRSVKAELSDKADMARALQGATPDVLVNNAGMMPPPGPFCDMAEADIARTVAVNLNAVLNVTRLLAPGMRDRRSGHIFFTGSTAGHAPFANLAVYGATKAAVGSFAQSLRLELAPSGVRVTEIVAGRVETNLYADILPRETRDRMYANNGGAKPEDVAAMVVAALALPPHANVSRFDIGPVRQS